MNEEIIDYNQFPVLDKIMINRFGTGDNINSIYLMMPLTEEEEIEIDKINEKLNNKETVNTHISIKDEVFRPEDIKIYGNIDITSQEDIDVIEKLLLKEYGKFHTIPAGFNYLRGTGKANGKIPLHMQTTKYLDVFKWYHFRIGKPNRVIVIKKNKHERR